MVRILTICLCLLFVTACKQSACSFSGEFAKSPDLVAAVSWLDVNVFDSKIDRKDLKKSFLPGPGFVALSRPFLASSNIVPGPFCQAMLVGKLNSQTQQIEGVFLSRGNYIGVFIAKDRVEPLLTEWKLASHSELISERVAVVCMPRD